MAKYSATILIIVLIFTATIGPAVAGGTARTVEMEVSGGAAIDPTEDHYSISYLGGWLTSNSDFFTLLLSHPVGGVFDINGQFTFEDGTTQTLDFPTAIDNPTSQLGRPLGIEGVIFGDIPADISKLKLQARISVTKDDRVNDLIKAITDEKNGPTALPAEVFTSQWLGYANLFSTISRTLFKTDKESVDIFGQSTISRPKKEKIVMMISSTKENDQNISSLLNSKLSFENGILKYDGNPTPKEWTYLVFKISKAEKRSAPQRAIGLDTPWSTVINTQLNVLPVNKVKDESQLEILADNTLTAIYNLQKFLVLDRSFTTYDRAAALYYYADRSAETIDATCKSKNFNNCPTSELKQYSDNIETVFPALQKGSKSNIALGAKAIDFLLQLQSAFSSGALGTSYKMPTLNQVEAVLKSDGQYITQTQPLKMEALKGLLQQSATIKTTVE